MSLRALCLSTICASSLLAGLANPVISLAATDESSPVPQKVKPSSAPRTQPAHTPVKNADPTAENTPDATPGQHEDIVVTAARKNRMYVSSGGDLGALGNKKGLDVPFNIRSYNSSLILNQQSQTLGDV
ncbi:MAG: TonB-dependent siderophore receptor, partial [Komagataeibacter saccharivorans]